MSIESLPMTFGMLDAVPITDAHIVSITDSNGPLPEDPVPEWSAIAPAGTYTAGMQVHRASTHTVYARVTPHTAVEATPPETAGPGIWKPLGVTNRAAAFDTYRSTQTWGTGELTFVLRPGGFVSAVWLGGLSATEVFVSVTDGVGGPVVYPETSLYLAGQGRYDWQTFFLAPVRVRESVYFGGIPLCADPVVTIRLTQLGGSPALGMVQMGRFVALGGSLYGSEIGRIRYSVIRTADDGTQQFTPRPGAGEVSVRAMVPRAKMEEIDYLLGLYDARPALWLVSTRDADAVFNKFGLLEARVRPISLELAELTGNITGMI